MEPDPVAASTQRQRERRKNPRYAVDEAASLLLVNHGSAIPCRILDLSLGGCRVHTTKPFLAGPMVRVEVIFKILGDPLRVPGVTQWTRRKEFLGIRFLDMSERKRAKLVELIEEINELRMTGNAAT
jgi:c-di-GMP-binding flagellar brake protein YcgR